MTDIYSNRYPLPPSVPYEPGEDPGLEFEEDELTIPAFLRRPVYFTEDDELSPLEKLLKEYPDDEK